MRWMKGLSALILVLLVVILWHRCKKEEVPPAINLSEELSILPLNRYSEIEPIDSFLWDQDTSWVFHEFSINDCRCVDDSPYLIGTSRGTNNSVIIHLEGGGACWPGHTGWIWCSQYVRVGISLYTFLNRVAENPFNDWNYIYIPYCDGSIHTGDNNADYNNDGEVDYHHWGFRNVSAGLNFMQSNHPDPDKILLTGCSGGGYGTIVICMAIRVRFPNTPIYVFNQSGPGLWNPKREDEWIEIRESWNIDQFIPPYCDECDLYLINIYDWMLRYDDNLRVGLYSSYQDYTIGVLYLGMPFVSYQDLLLKHTGNLNTNHPNTFKRFFIEGTEHCPADLDYEIDGIRMMDWLEAMVNGGGEWVDLLE